MNVILRLFVLLAAGLIAFAAPPAAAQPPHPAAQQGGAIAGEAPYDPATEATLRGAVQEVKEMKNVVTVTHLVLGTADHGSVEVHLGPSSWVVKQSVSFKTGEQIEIIGSRVKYAGSDVVVARQIRKNGQTLTLRDTQGISRWSRGR